MKWSSAGAVLAAACAEYAKDKKATLDEFDRIVRETRDAMTGQWCVIKTIDKPDEATRTKREQRRRRKELNAVLRPDVTRERTGEGRARARARGVRFGRKPKLTTHQIAEALRRRDAGEALTEIAKTYNVSHSTISRLPYNGNAGAVAAE
jgi:hypothetical protein